MLYDLYLVLKSIDASESMPLLPEGEYDDILEDLSYYHYIDYRNNDTNDISILTPSGKELFALLSKKFA